MRTLIIGGTGGLGLALAASLGQHDEVHITGRQQPEQEGIVFHQLDLSGPGKPIAERIGSLIDQLPPIDQLIYAAGFYQEGTVTDLTDEQIQEMLAVCLEGAIYTTQCLLKKQGKLPVFIAVTSTSQYTPRLLEPIYTAAKAGLGAFANSLSLDPRVGKTLVAAPAGILTKFHEGRSVDTSTYLKPEWVADTIVGLLNQQYRYKYVRILRDPAHVEEQETRL